MERPSDENGRLVTGVQWSSRKWDSSERQPCAKPERANHRLKWLSGCDTTTLNRTRLTLSSLHFLSPTNFLLCLFPVSEKWSYLLYGQNCHGPPQLLFSLLPFIESVTSPYQLYLFSSVQFSYSVVPDSATPWTAAHQASLSITKSRSSLKLMSIESVMPSNHLIFCHLLSLPPSIFPSIGVFTSESVLYIRWPKYWSFSFSLSPSKVYPGLTSFRMDWFDILAVQWTLKSLLQHHNSKTSIV